MNFTSESSASKTSALAEHLSKTHNVTALPCRADMGSTDGPTSIIEFARKSQFATQKSGNLTVHIVINNAGVAGDRKLKDAKTEDFVQDFDKLYNVNVRGPLLLMAAVEPYLPTDRSGRVVNLSSVSSSTGFEGQSIYGGTKAAVEAMTRTWARELRERCTVNAVNPGPVATDMYSGVSKEFAETMMHWNSISPGVQVVEGKDSPEVYKVVREGNEGRGLGGRAATAEDIAGIVGMLCTSESQFCTGSVVNANGGMRMSIA